MMKKKSVWSKKSTITNITGEMAYFVAAVVVLYNVEDQSQRHYLGHTQDIRYLVFY